MKLGTLYKTQGKVETWTRYYEIPANADYKGGFHLLGVELYEGVFVPVHWVRNNVFAALTSRGLLYFHVTYARVYVELV